MKRTYLLILMLFTQLAIFANEINSTNILNLFVKWYSNKELMHGKIRFGKPEDFIDPKKVEYNQKDDNLTPGIFEYIKKDAAYTAKYDFDNDGNEEIAILFIMGSGRFPQFYLLKKYSDKYRIIISEKKYLEPVIFEGQVYFIESKREFNSGRWNDFIINKIVDGTHIESVMRIRKNYKYSIDEKLISFINTEIINKIAVQDYSFLGVIEKFDDEFTIVKDSYSIKADIKWTSVGYFATTINLNVFNSNKLLISFERIWGFSYVEQNGKKYIVVLRMDDFYRVSAIIDFRVSVFNIDTQKEEFTEYIKAKEDFEIYE